MQLSRLNKIRLVWAGPCVLLLVACVLTYNDSTSRDNPIVLALVMLALSFPSGYLFVIAFGYIPPQILGVRAEMSVFWAGCFVAG